VLLAVTAGQRLPRSRSAQHQADKNQHSNRSGQLQEARISACRQKSAPFELRVVIGLVLAVSPDF
jgi:hypothetical protein